jgi:hypothetical protein
MKKRVANSFVIPRRLEEANGESSLKISRDSGSGAPRRPAMTS